MKFSTLFVQALLSVAFAAPIAGADGVNGISLFTKDDGSIWISEGNVERMVSNDGSLVLLKREDGVDPKVNFCLRPHCGHNGHGHHHGHHRHHHGCGCGEPECACEPYTEPIPVEPCYDPCYDPCEEPCEESCGCVGPCCCGARIIDKLCPSNWCCDGPEPCCHEPPCHPPHEEPCAPPPCH